MFVFIIQSWFRDIYTNIHNIHWIQCWFSSFRAGLEIFMVICYNIHWIQCLFSSFRAGLEIEEDVAEGDTKIITYYKLHAPWTVLAFYAEELNFRAPLQVSIELRCLTSSHANNFISDLPAKACSLLTTCSVQASQYSYKGFCSTLNGRLWDARWQQTYQVNCHCLRSFEHGRITKNNWFYLVSLLLPSIPKVTH